MLKRWAMRSMLWSVAILLASPSAFAGSTKHDSSSNGGRLGSVSSGIDRATSKPSKDSQPSRPPRDQGSDVVVVDDCCYASSSLEEPPAKPFVWPKVDVGATGFAGAQKVVESDGSLSLELSLVFLSWSSGGGTSSVAATVGATGGGHVVFCVQAARSTAQASLSIERIVEAVAGKRNAATGGRW